MKRPRILVLTGYGINCERETAYAFTLPGVDGDAELVHVSDLIAHPEHLDTFHILAIPGGFAFGDDISAGIVLATKLRYRLEAEILGTRTFGRASLQEFIPLEDGGMIRLSVARCVGPDGESWEREGLEPDQAVVLDPENTGDEDAVLLKALELLERSAEPVLKAA